MNEFNTLHERIEELERELHARQLEIERLRGQHIGFETLANSANDGILIAASDGETVFANARAAEIMGYAIPELLKTTMKDLAHPDAFPILQERLNRRLAGQPVPNQYDTAIRHKEGHKVPVEITAAKITWQDQPADLVIIRDITERWRAQSVISVRLQLMEYAAEHTLEELLRETLDRVGELVNSPIGFYHFVEPDQVTLSLQAW